MLSLNRVGEMTVDYAASYGFKTKWEKETQDFLIAAKKQISVDEARRRDLPLTIRSLEDYFYNMALSEDDKAIYDELVPSKKGHKKYPRIPVSIKNSKISLF